MILAAEDTYLLGDRWTEVGRYSDLINYAVGGGVVLLLVVLVGRRAARRRRGLDPVTGEPRVGDRDRTGGGARAGDPPQTRRATSG